MLHTRAHGCARVFNEGNFFAKVFDDRLTTKFHKVNPKTCYFLQLLGFNKIYVFIRKYANAIQKVREV